jgi:sirohydrochlorin cobaltochelatase
LPDIPLALSVFFLQSLPAYLLVFHGSRDPRPEAAARTLAQFFLERISHVGSGTPLDQQAESEYSLAEAHSFSPRGVEALAVSTANQPLVEVAALEGDSLPLHEQIYRLGQTLQSIAGAESAAEPRRLLLLPLFLLAGVHVMEDIPAEVALAQKALGQHITLELMPYLGSHSGLHRLITERLSALPVEASILLAHGSRRPGANQSIEMLSERLGAVTAYWSVPPNLEVRLQELMNLGFKKIAILPYFLFAGSTTDAIAETVDRLSQQFLSLDLLLTPPLEAYPELADLLVDLATGRGKRVLNYGL